MEERKTSFVLHLDMLEDIQEMTNEEKAAFLDFVVNYNLGKINLEDIPAGATKRYFRLFANQFDRDHQKWMNTKEKRKQAGKKGGLAKASKPSKCYDSLANASDAKHKVNVNVNVKENVKVNANIKKTIHRVENLEERLIRLLQKNPRRLTLNDKQAKALARIKKPIEEHDMELLEYFFSLEKSKDYDQTWSRKQSLDTILNNLDQQLDLAHDHRQSAKTSYALPKPKHIIYR
jgi:hypothetical protein